MQKILITGGSGLIGQPLTQILISKGYRVNWLSRSKKEIPGVSVFLWDIDKGIIDDAAFTDVDTIIHLAGEGIADKRWTTKRKELIIESRRRSSELLINRIKQYPGKIKTVICASAIGFYDAQNKELQNEESKTGTGFLCESVVAWENANKKFAELDLSLVIFRIGIVLSKKGGAYKELMMTKPIGILPLLGNGKQMYSWIHIEDVCGIFLFAMENKLAGLYNAVAPNPVSQKKLMRSVKKYARGFQIIFPVPAIGLKLVLGEMSNAVLNSQTISAKKILDAGYTFRFSEIDQAIQDIEKSNVS